MPAPTNTQTGTPAVEANGTKPTPRVITGTNLPAPAPDSRVDVKGKLKDGSILDYEADAKDVATETVKTAPRISSEQAAEMTGRSQQTGRRYTELDEWLAYWQEFADADDGDDISTDVRRFKISVTREADIMIPGMSALYSRPCPSRQFLGRYSFLLDPNQFMGQLQVINGNSGGEFYITLIDGDGQSIKETWFRQVSHNRVIPVEGQQNGTWGGAIPNPINAQSTGRKENETKGPRTAKEFLKELKGEIDDLKAIGLIPEKQESTNNLLDSVNATAAAAVIGKLGEALSAITTETNKRTSGEEKGFFRSLAEGDEGQKRIWSGFDTATGLLGGIAGDWMRERAIAQKEQRDLERLKFLAQHPELATAAASQSQTTNTQSTGETIYDYICRKCEEADTSFDFATDATIAEFAKTNAGEMTLVRGTLAQDLPAEDVLSKFITVCRFKGKGERAENLRALPQTIQFIEKAQRSVKGA